MTVTKHPRRHELEEYWRLYYIVRQAGKIKEYFDELGPVTGVDIDILRRLVQQIAEQTGIENKSIAESR